MEEIIKMDDMQKLASSLVDYMRGDGGAAVAYIDGSFESESASERKRPLAILHTRNVANRLKQGLEDVCGIAAESDRVMFVHFCLRDGLALLKDRLMGNL